MTQPIYTRRTGQSTLSSVANLACAWLLISGFDIEVWRQLGSAHVSASSNPGLLAAALDLLALLDSTPDGRQAVADLLGQSDNPIQSSRTQDGGLT